MPGAYSSKPEAAIVVPEYPDIPINWNINWPWPGPNPPGYSIQDPAIELTVPATVEGSDEAYTPVLTLGKWTDSAGGPAGLPPSVTGQTWSAEMNGAPLRIKTDAMTAFALEAEVPYDVVGVHYQAVENVQFEISEADVGSVITLSASSFDEEGNEVVTTQDVTVIAAGGNYLYVEVDCGNGAPIGYTNTMQCDPGTGMLTSVDGSDANVTIDTQTLETLIGNTITGELTGTNFDAEFTNYASGGVTAYLFDRYDQLLGFVSVDFSAELPPGGSGSETKAVFQIVDIDTIVALN